MSRFDRATKGFKSKGKCRNETTSDGTMAEQHAVKLLGVRQSFYAVRVRIALELKGVHYEFVEEDLSNKSQLLLDSNPVHKKIPVLIHNGKPISESLIILQYIDETWGHAPALLPRHPYDRALSRFWASFADDKIHSALFQVLGTNGVDQEKAKEEAVANFGRVEGALATTFKGKPYFEGEEIGYLDIVLGSRVLVIQAIEQICGVKFIDAENTPLLHAWTHRFLGHPCVKKFLPHSDELLGFLRGRRNKALGQEA